MPNSNGVFEFPVSAGLLRSLKVKCVCVQTPPPEMAVMEVDGPRPRALEMARAIFGDAGGGCLLNQYIGGSDPVVVLFPELTFPLDVWPELDRRIRAVERSLLVIAGFGFAEVPNLFALIDDNDHVQLAVREGHEPAPKERVNGGWCWVHRFTSEAHHDCLFFCKNFPERKVENETVPNVYGCPDLLHVQFDDVDVVPLICSDIVCGVDDSPLDRVKPLLGAAAARNGRMGLLLGPLYQPKPWHNTWRDRLSAAANLSVNLRIVIANHAMDKPRIEENDDRWRNLTGGYRRFVSISPIESLFGRWVNEASVCGYVARDTDVSALFAEVDWNVMEPGTSRTFWHVSNWQRFRRDGSPALMADRPAGHKVVDIELHRFTRRYPPEDNQRKRVEPGLKRLRKRFHDHDGKGGITILHRIAKGLDGTASDIEIDKVHQSPEWLRKGLHGLAGVVADDNVSWAEGEVAPGQVHIEDGHDRVEILVWSGPMSNGDSMMAAIKCWLGEISDRRRLVIIARPANGDIEDGLVSLEDGDDITTAGEHGLLDAQEGVANPDANLTTKEALRSACVIMLGTFEQEFLIYTDPALARSTTAGEVVDFLLNKWAA